MLFEANQLYHLYNRGNNRIKIFYKKENYLYFLRKVRKHLLPYCDILAYCLMPNHFHFLIQIKDLIEESTNQSDLKGNMLNKNIGILQASYTRAIHKQEGKTGSLFQQHSKAKRLENGSATRSQITAVVNDYPFICFNYIHQNPLRTGLVEKMEDWEFSSFKDYVGIRKGTLCNRKLTEELLDLPNSAELYRLAYDVIDPEKVKGLF